MKSNSVKVRKNLAGAGVHFQNEFKDFTAKMVRQLEPKIQEVFDDVLDSARDNLERNGSIYSEALTDSLGTKILLYFPTQKYGFSMIRGYVGVDVNSDKIYKGKLKIPAIYAPILEYGGSFKIKKLVGKIQGKRGRARNIYREKTMREIGPKPFMRPAVVGLEERIKSAIKKVAKSK
jgi:hypothetical protein